MSRKTLVTTALAAAVLVAVPAGLAGPTAAPRPSAPTIAGPNTTTPGKHTYAFSSVEKGVPGAKLRFRCSLDSARLHACARRVTLSLAAGAHTLRAQAVDPAGSHSAVTRLAITARAPVPELAVTRVWQADVTGGRITAGQFSLTTGPDGNLYVADVANDQVAVFDTAGHALRRFGSPGSGPGQFAFEKNSDPQDASVPFSSIAVDGHSGVVYVGESQRLQRFGSQGDYQLGWGSPGTDNGQFSRVVDLAVDGSGTVYALEDRPHAQGRVQEFDANGRFLATFGRGKILDPGGIALASDGSAVVSDDDANHIDVFSRDGSLVRTFGEPGNAPGQLDFPTDLALAGNTLYVADQNHLRIVRFDLASGKPTGYWSVGATTPVGLTVDAAGAVYVIGDNGTIVKDALP